MHAAANPKCHLRLCSDVKPGAKTSRSVPADSEKSWRVVPRLIFEVAMDEILDRLTVAFNWIKRIQFDDDYLVVGYAAGFNYALLQSRGRHVRFSAEPRTWPPHQEVAELPLVMTADPPHHCFAGNRCVVLQQFSGGRCNKEIGCSEIQFCVCESGTDRRDSAACIF